MKPSEIIIKKASSGLGSQANEWDYINAILEYLDEQHAKDGVK